MIKTFLLACLLGIATAQYGSSGGSGYGPDGVRNRYFILGHGRGPISTTLGSGVYGTSLGGGSSSGYRPSSSSSRYGGASGGAYGGANGGAYGGASSYSAPAAPSYGLAEPAYAPAPAPRAYAPAPRSYAPAPRSYAPAAPSYAPAAPAYIPAAPVRSYSAPVEYSAPRSSYGGSGSSYGGSGSSYGGSSYGNHDDLAQPTPYDFGYDVHNEHGDQQSRQESGDGHGNVKGSYGYRDSYGIFRHVDYVADGHGFRANVRTNEPGTDNQDPADVKIQVEHGGYSSGY